MAGTLFKRDVEQQTGMKWENWIKRYTFQTEEGITGKLGVVKPPEKLRMKWQRPDYTYTKN